MVLACLFVLLFSHLSYAYQDDLSDYGVSGTRPDVESISMVVRAVEECSKRLMETREALVVAREEGRDTSLIEAKVPLLEELLADHRKRLELMADALEQAQGELPVWLKGALAAVLDGGKEVGNPRFFVEKKRKSLREKLVDSLNESGVGPWLSLGDGGEDLVVYLELPVMFAAGSTAVSAEYRDTLRQVAQTLKVFEPAVEVISVTDAAPSDKLFALSTERAANVAREFLQSGISSDAFSIRTKSEEKAMDRVEVSFRIQPEKGAAAG